MKIRQSSQGYFFIDLPRKLTQTMGLRRADKFDMELHSSYRNDGNDNFIEQFNGCFIKILRSTNSFSKPRTTARISISKLIMSKLDLKPGDEILLSIADTNTFSVDFFENVIKNPEPCPEYPDTPVFGEQPLKNQFETQSDLILPGHDDIS